jgi:hypothetical protein
VLLQIYLNVNQTFNLSVVKSTIDIKINNEIAFGLNCVGIYDGLHLPLDFSFGSSVSGDYNMGKFSLGMSW